MQTLSVLLYPPRQCKALPPFCFLAKPKEGNYLNADFVCFIIKGGKMRYLILFLIPFGIFAATAQSLYNQALGYEETEANFTKAKQLYSKIIAEHVTEQEYVARAMYHIAFISEMYAQKATAESYYKMVLSKYSKFKGLKYLATSGLARLSKGTVSCNPNTVNSAKSIKSTISTGSSASKTSVAIKKGPFDNDKYRHGKTAPLYILNIGEKIELNFDGVKGLGASDPSVADISPTTSVVTIVGKKVGFSEIMVKENNGTENYVNINVVDATNNKIDNIYLIKGEHKEIHITNMEKIAADNDNIELSAKDNVISMNCKKEGNLTLTLMKKDGTKVDVKVKVLKPYDKKRTLLLKPLETKEIKFDKVASISVTTHGIVDVKQDSKSVKITGTSKGKTIVIIYGRDNAQLKLDITVN